VANISPGERLDLKIAGREWLIEFYMVREHGVPLLGPPPGEVIESISRDEFLDSVRPVPPLGGV
jgi:hypothetical protein